MPVPITFDTLRARLIELVNARIHGGDVTERGLSRIMGLSQSQIHNVLKGARKLQPELADRLMGKFSLTILDLMDNSEAPVPMDTPIRKAPGRAEVSSNPYKEHIG